MMEKTITYNMKTHTYGVELYIDGKYFYGEARCSKEDWDDESELFGYGLATDRAMVDYYKWLIKHYKKRYKLISDFVKSLTQYKDFDPAAASTKHMYHQLNIIKKNLDMAKHFKAHHERCADVRIKSVKGKEASAVEDKN